MHSKQERQIRTKILPWATQSYRDFVGKKTLYMCISERLMHDAACYDGTPGAKFTKCGE